MRPKLLNCFFVVLLLPALRSAAQVKEPESKAELQQLMLLSKQQQAELQQRRDQKVLLEQQQKELDQKEKALLQLRVEKKQGELDAEKRRQADILLKNRLQARIEEAIKDKQISAQKVQLSYNQRWLFFLATLVPLVVIIALIMNVNRRRTKRLNKLISSQHDELEQISKVKDRVLSVVGHDMRTPLNILVSFTQLLKNADIPPAKMKEYMEQFESTLNHTSFLMDNLLQWAASQMHGYKPIITEVQVSGIAEDVIKLLRERAGKKNIRLENALSPETTALADSDMMAVVLRNLVSNAIKFTERNGSVQISSTRLPDRTIIAVADTGIGMSEKNLNLFNSPELASTSTTQGTDKEKGTGLGLLLCKTFTALMNGQIRARKNEKNTGTIFEITLSNGTSIARQAVA